MRVRTRGLQVVALVASSMLTLIGCDSTSDCSYGAFRCNANVSQVCATGGQWIDTKDCTVDYKICQQGLCQTCPQGQFLCASSLSCVDDCATVCTTSPHTCWMRRACSKDTSRSCKLDADCEKWCEGKPTQSCEVDTDCGDNGSCGVGPCIADGPLNYTMGDHCVVSCSSAENQCPVPPSGSCS